MIHVCLLVFLSVLMSVCLGGCLFPCLSVSPSAYLFCLSACTCSLVQAANTCSCLYQLHQCTAHLLCIDSALRLLAHALTSFAQSCFVKVSQHACMQETSTAQQQAKAAAKKAKKQAQKAKKQQLPDLAGQHASLQPETVQPVCLTSSPELCDPHVAAIWQSFPLTYTL